MDDRTTTLAQAADTPWETDEEAVEYLNDPKAFILNRCKYFLSKTRLDSNQILIATYFPPEATHLKGIGGINIIIPKAVTGEAKWQSRVGLLVAKGPLAWVPDDRVNFGGTMHEIGSWVVFDRQDGRQIAINRIHCRRLRDVDVWAETDEPFLFY